MDQNTKDILEAVNFIKDHMMMKEDEATRGEIREIVREETSNRFDSIENKIAGIERRLDIEAMRRSDENIPSRVSDLEVKVFGKSRTPQV